MVEKGGLRRKLYIFRFVINIVEKHHSSRITGIISVCSPVCFWGGIQFYCTQIEHSFLRPVCGESHAWGSIAPWPRPWVPSLSAIGQKLSCMRSPAERLFSVQCSCKLRVYARARRRSKRASGNMVGDDSALAQRSPKNGLSCKMVLQAVGKVLRYRYPSNDCTEESRSSSSRCAARAWDGMELSITCNC